MRGFIPANTKFMQGLRERCDKHGMLLGADEVQAGYGRTGKFWSHSHFDVQPDIVVTAKGLASGFPLSACAAPRKIMEKGLPGSQGGTYGGNVVACAAALATLDVIEEEGLVDNAGTQGARLKERLELLADKEDGIGDVRGKGLMVGVEFQKDGKPDGARAEKVAKECEKHGLLLLRCGPGKQVVRFLPPLVVSREQIDEGVDIFAKAVDSSS